MHHYGISQEGNAVFRRKDQSGFHMVGRRKYDLSPEGIRLKRLRTMRRFTQGALGAASGVSLRTIANIEGGTAYYSKQSVRSIATALNVPIAALVDAEVDVVPLSAAVTSGGWIEGELFYPPEDQKILVVAPHPKHEAVDAFKVQNGWIIGTVLPNNGYRENDLCVVWRRHPKNVKAGELALRRFTSAEGSLLSLGIYTPKSQQQLVPDAFGDDADPLLEPASENVVAEKSKGVGWFVAFGGDPDQCFIRADDETIEQVWVVISRFRHVR